MGRKADISMNLLKWVRLCSHLSLLRLGGLGDTSLELQHRHVEDRQTWVLGVAFEGCFFSPTTMQQIQ